MKFFFYVLGFLLLTLGISFMKDTLNCTAVIFYLFKSTNIKRQNPIRFRPSNKVPDPHLSSALTHRGSGTFYLSPPYIENSGLRYRLLESKKINTSKFIPFQKILLLQPMLLFQ